MPFFTMFDYYLNFDIALNHHYQQNVLSLNLWKCSLDTENRYLFTRLPEVMHLLIVIDINVRTLLK